MGISFLWQQLLPFALTWSYHLKTACHFRVNTKFILFYKVEKKIQKPLAHFMNNMSICVCLFKQIQHVKTFGTTVYILSFMMRFFPWLPEMLDFKLTLQTGNTVLTSEFKQSFPTDWKQEYKLMTSPSTTLSVSFVPGVHFVCRGQRPDEMR